METESTYRDLYQSFFQDILDDDYFPEKESAGQPKFYESPQALANEAIDYLTDASERNEPLRLTGFILHSKLNHRVGLNNYLKYGPEFKKVVDRIKMIIEDFNVKEIYGANVHGAKFVLQCGFGWIPVEKQQIENHIVNVSIGKKDDDE